MDVTYWMDATAYFMRIIRKPCTLSLSQYAWNYGKKYILECNVHSQDGVNISKLKKKFKSDYSHYPAMWLMSKNYEKILSQIMVLEVNQVRVLYWTRIVKRFTITICKWTFPKPFIIIWFTHVRYPLRNIFVQIRIKVNVGGV